MRPLRTQSLSRLNPRGYKLRTSDRRAVSVHSDSESQAVLWVLSVDKPASSQMHPKPKASRAPEESRNGVLHKATHPSCTPRSQVRAHPGHRSVLASSPQCGHGPRTSPRPESSAPCSRCLAPHTPCEDCSQPLPRRNPEPENQETTESQSIMEKNLPQETQRRAYVCHWASWPHGT